MHGAPSETQRLRNRIVELLDRVEELESLLGAGRSNNISLAPIGAPPLALKICGVLLKRAVVSRETAYTIMYGGLPDSSQPNERVVDIHVWRLRKSLRKHGIDVKTQWGSGWYFTPADKAKLNALIGGASS